MLGRIGIVLLFALVEVRADYQQCLDDWSFGGGPNNLTYYKICELVGFLSDIEDNLDELDNLDDIYALLNATYNQVVELDIDLDALGQNLTNKLMDICDKLNDILALLQSSNNEEDLYQLVFRGTPGTGGDIFQAWTGADISHVTTDSSSLCAIWPPTDASIASCTMHYRNSTAFNGNNWADSVVKVKYVLYDNGVEVQSFVFNAISSDIKSWFASYRLQDSTCCTCSTYDDHEPGDFSLEGSTFPPSISARRFQIVTEAHSCPNYKGLTVVVNAPSGTSPGCNFDQLPGPYPRILYSYGDCGSKFNIREQYGEADALGVFVMTIP
ncbi:hypothetical protein CHS0354_007888 [Potamilus streckersoni]|uniref:Uncharacterized protein n=1 Tax=Potamilus streckersoni TaxID=2493646 RepID=A0AAE0S8W0_9BIVA|nr:hypothetical protein CHS0354_007888 [Potamilus streckersoni]